MSESRQPNVVIWTNRGCGACTQAKQFLGRKGVAFNERRLRAEPSIQHAFARATGGARTVPQIIIDDHRIGGFDDMLQLERTGELDVMLGRAPALPAKTAFQRFVAWFRG